MAKNGKEKKITDIEAKDIMKLAGGPDEALFFVTWLKNGLNATKAYEELHPGVTYGSARELGSRMLAKVDRSLLLSAYDLGPDRYFKQLTEGLDATKRDQYSGEVSEDHRTRRLYHEALGKILGIEQNTTVAIQNNGDMTVEIT